MRDAFRRLAPSYLQTGLNKIRRRYWALTGTTSHWEVLTKLDSFTANSLNFYKFPDMTYHCANDFPKLLDRLSAEFGPVGAGGHEFELRSPDSFTAKGLDPSELGALLERHGSDKSMIHDYHHVYHWIFEDLGRSRALNVLEIGLGTNNPGLVSTMGAAGVPGASLRAFRDYLPNANIFGADVDRAILFHEERIKTAFVDQLNFESFAQMTDSLGCRHFDLFIDDGLHALDANLNTLHFALSQMAIGSWVVIEDILERTCPSWHVIARLLDPARFRCHLVRCKKAFMFVVHRVAQGRA